MKKNGGKQSRDTIPLSRDTCMVLRNDLERRLCINLYELVLERTPSKKCP
jgi:hypothetical protein